MFKEYKKWSVELFSHCPRWYLTFNYSSGNSGEWVPDEHRDRETSCSAQEQCPKESDIIPYKFDEAGCMAAGLR